MDLFTIFVSDHIGLPVSVHTHNYYQLIYCEKGVGTIISNGEKYTAIPGKAYIIKPMDPHGIIPKTTLRLLEVKFTVDNPSLDASLNRLPCECEIDEHLSLRMSMKEIAKEGLSEKMYSNEATNAALLLFLIRLLRKYNISVKERVCHSIYFDTYKRKNSIDDVRDFEFVKVVDYIEKHFSEQITLDDLAELAHFEKSYLSVRFNEIWGISPMQYVNWMRIERAKSLLENTDKSVTEISEEVGFNSIHYFSRYFKEKENISPHDYRINLRNNSNDDK